ncbi:hypothetical protein QOZ80_8BG0657960 [Eleusine coracana subsp. coracana]|nr:hypothetical protein QOZ80_8BG0657960 [Eleusine coracana subsp. coracana]
MAEAAVLALSKIGCYLAGEAATFITTKFSDLKELPNTVQRIRRELLMMNIFIRKAGASYLSDELLKAWTTEVRMLAYRIEDIMDSFSYHYFQLKQDQTGKKLVKGVNYALVFGRIANDLSQIEREIEHISKLKDLWIKSVHEVLPTQINYIDQQVPYSSLPQLVKDENIMGFKKERHRLQEWLSLSIPAGKLVSVLGMGGMGKTTVVTSVFEKIKDSFDIHAWLTVSQACRGLDALLRELLNIVTKQTSLVAVEGRNKEQMKPEDISELKRHLKAEFKQKKCIIVFDDVWDRRVYDGISDVFEDIRMGSHIIITTRKHDVASLATSAYQMELMPLNINDALHLFCARAFPNKDYSDWASEVLDQANGITQRCEQLSLDKYQTTLRDLATSITEKCERSALPKCPSELQEVANSIVMEIEGLSRTGSLLELQDLAVKIVKKCHDLPLVKCPPELQELAIDIVKKCRGLPLAIVSVGSLLSSRNHIEHVWRGMYNELPCELEKDDQVRGILNLSYYDMPSDLRNCFLYCSLFPEDYHFSRENLVRLWIAEGFAATKGDSTPEEVAEGYLLELIRRNMLQLVDSDELGLVNTCKMHDILRELALSISKAEMFGTVNDFGAVVQMDTHVRRISSYKWKKMKKGPSKMKLPHLRTLMGIHTIIDYVPSVLSESKYLTVLELQNSDIQELPVSIGNLFNLRYIGLRNTRLSSLPESIKNLCNLQTLDVKSTNIRVLPYGISKLTKIRHLLAGRFADKERSEFRYFVGVEAPIGLSNLEEMQTLETVHANNDLPEQLDNLLQLRSLWIDNITADCCTKLFITLSTMPLLSCLLLSASDEKEKLCFRYLNPTSTKLHKLIMRGQWAPGTLDCPIFQNHGRNLKYLALSRCHLEEDQLVALPSLVLNLTYLRLNKISSPRTLILAADSFRHLKMLVLKDMDDVDLIQIQNGALPVIESLYITSLSKLATVPQGLTSLGSLKKLWLLGLHKSFKDQWNMSGIQNNLQHILEIRV